MPRRSSSRNANTVFLDFTGVETGSLNVPEGTYRAKLASITQEESRQGNQMLVGKFQLLEGVPGATLKDYFVLSPQALWKLKGLLVVLGEEVGSGMMELNLDALVDRELTVVVANEVYEGESRPKIQGYSTAEEETTPPPKKAEPEKPSRRSRKAAAAISVGDDVVFTDEGEDIEGTVTSIDGKVAVVDTDDGEWEIELSDLRKA